MGRKQSPPVEIRKFYLRDGTWVPASQWHPQSKEEKQRVLRLEAEKVYSFSDYNRNRYYSYKFDSWLEIPRGENLSGFERGHDYTLLSREVNDQEVFLVTAPRIPDRETEPLIQGLGAWSNIPGYGRRTSVQAFDWNFFIPASAAEEFLRRVAEIGGRASIRRVEIPEMEELARRIQTLADEVRQSHAAIADLRERVLELPRESLSRIEALLEQGKTACVQISQTLRHLKDLEHQLSMEYGRLPEKAQARSLVQEANSTADKAEKLLGEMKTAAEAAVKDAASTPFSEGSIAFDWLQITLTEGDQAIVQISPGAVPEEIRLAVEAMAAAGRLRALAGRFVHIFCPNPAVVAAFVLAAKPWLKALTVNGIVVIPPPRSQELPAHLRAEK